MGHQTVEQMPCKASEVGEGAMTATAFLFGAKKLDQNRGFPASQLVNGVALRWEVDKAGLVHVITIGDRRRPDGPQVTLGISEPRGGHLRLSDKRLAKRTL